MQLYVMRQNNTVDYIITEERKKKNAYTVYCVMT